MRKNFQSLYWYLVVCITFGVLVFFLIFLTGCLQSLPNGNSPIDNPIPFGPEWFDALIEITQAFTIANTASAPVNPFVLPIGVGLAGLTAILEALRRQEKSGRKHAEGVINGNNKTT